MIDDQTPSLTDDTPGAGIERVFLFRNEALCNQIGTQRDGDHWGNCNTIYVCPECGVFWAQIIRGDRRSFPLWHIDVHYCDKHMSQMWWDAMPGCFGQPNYPAQYDHMPRAVLAHDFLQLMSLRDHLNGKTTQ